MPTPREGYFLADKTRVPSVTTVLRNLGWKTGGLMHWAWTEGSEGRDYRKTRDDAADAGTIAHAMVEAHIHGKVWQMNGEDPDIIPIACTAFEQFLEWEDVTQLRIVATEVKLVSEKYGYGGTPDAFALTKKGLCMPDWKASKGLYADYLIQLAAYGAVWEEVTGLMLEGGYHLCRFDKEGGGFLHRWLPREALQPAFRVFLRLREIHEQKKPLEALAK